MFSFSKVRLCDIKCCDKNTYTCCYDCSRVNDCYLSCSNSKESYYTNPTECKRCRGYHFNDFVNILFEFLGMLIIAVLLAIIFSILIGR